MRRGLVFGKFMPLHRGHQLLIEAAFAECDRRTSAAQAMGAVNTLWREGDILWGDNTDAGGFLGSLDEEAPAWRREVHSAAILGAGGASRAVVYGLPPSDMIRPYAA